MIQEQVQFHNTAELEPVPDGGWRMLRYPREVAIGLGNASYIRGRLAARASTGCEIRFICSSPISGLSADLVHPSDAGHSMIAQHLAQVIHNIKTGANQI